MTGRRRREERRARRASRRRFNWTPAQPPLGDGGPERAGPGATYGDRRVMLARPGPAASPHRQRTPRDSSVGTAASRDLPRVDDLRPFHHPDAVVEIEGRIAVGREKL